MSEAKVFQFFGGLNNFRISISSAFAKEKERWKQLADYACGGDVSVVKSLAEDGVVPQASVLHSLVYALGKPLEEVVSFEKELSPEDRKEWMREMRRRGADVFGSSTGEMPNFPLEFFIRLEALDALCASVSQPRDSDKQKQRDIKMQEFRKRLGII